MTTEELDFSKPEELQTENKKNVRILCTDGAKPYEVIGAIEDSSGWAPACWTKQGRYRITDRSSHDLIRKSPRVRGWLNVYARSIVGEFLSETKERAMERARGDCLGQVFIDLELET